MGSVVIQECEEGIFCLRMKGLRMKGVDTHVIYAKFQLFAVCRRNLSQKTVNFLMSLVGEMSAVCLSCIHC